MPKIKKEKLSDKVYDVLEEMIANNRFQQGTRINVEQLTKELGVSRTPVWEAVGRLEQEGILKNITNRGVFMVTLTPQMCLDLYQVREVLEGMAGRLAVPNIDDRTLANMEKCLTNQHQMIVQGDMIGYSRLDFEFHSAVYENCGNPYLRELLESNKQKMRPIAMHIGPIISRLYHDHVKIFEAIKVRDPKLTETAFRNHNRKMIKQINKNIKENTWKVLGKDSN